MGKQSVLVCPVIKEAHQIVDQNVLTMLIVLKMKRVKIKSVEILVPALAALELDVKLLIMLQFVRVQHDILAIHLLDASQ